MNRDRMRWTIAGAIVAGIAANAIFIAAGRLEPPAYGEHARVMAAFLGSLALSIVAGCVFVVSALRSGYRRPSRLIDSAAPAVYALLALWVGSCAGIVTGQIAGDVVFERRFRQALQEFDRAWTAIDAERARSGEWPSEASIRERVDRGVRALGYSSRIVRRMTDVEVELLWDGLVGFGGRWSSRDRSWRVESP